MNENENQDYLLDEQQPDLDVHIDDVAVKIDPTEEQIVEKNEDKKNPYDEYCTNGELDFQKFS